MQRSAIARLLWCGLGAAVGGAVAFVPCFAACLAVLASPGGSAVFLFGLTRAPAAQPRALFGGHPGGALIGIACYQLFGDSLWVYALAQVLALWYMLLTRTVHPPAGANPMIMIHAHSQSDCALGAGFHWSVPLGYRGSCWSRLYPGLSHYPVSWLDQSPPSLFWGGWNE
ncbi:HPP family protein [Nitrosospira multiformis]|uniref:HPP family protein n=1 Tax=Nitrosospira multiformis TaxID=1231 RepID=UPI000942BEB2|nr:HPP family protein [Nitrosospira multiformis]